MYRFPGLPHCVLLAASIIVANAADCNLGQQRQAGDPSGEDIATALTKNNQLESVCAGNFPPLNDRVLSYNHWNLIYNATRDDPSEDLQSCQDGFKNIIDQCISNGNYWGGTWSLNGFTYAIYNSIYPANGLAPSDEGGPTSTGGGGPGPTTTDSGQFAPTTLSQYATLQDETTVTTTTTRDGVPIIFPIIIGPGGVAL
ncbi:MAG: hypothetical protein Q9168_008231, partial [Polycauliona sp. 1 TL-2023]